MLFVVWLGMPCVTCFSFLGAKSIHKLWLLWGPKYMLRTYVGLFEVPGFEGFRNPVRLPRLGLGSGEHLPQAGFTCLGPPALWVTFGLSGFCWGVGGPVAQSPTPRVHWDVRQTRSGSLTKLHLAGRVSNQPLRTQKQVAFAWKASSL